MSDNESVWCNCGYNRRDATVGDSIAFDGRNDDNNIGESIMRDTNGFSIAACKLWYCR